MHPREQVPSLRERSSILPNVPTHSATPIFQVQPGPNHTIPPVQPGIATLVVPHPQDEWKKQLLQSYTTLDELVKNQLLSSEEAKRLVPLGDQFKIRLTPYYASLIQPRPDCPIRRQAIPHVGEEDPTLPQWAEDLSQEIYKRSTPWHSDAIGDVVHLVRPRLTHRYQNRVIVHLSSMCAVYCRFCFRKTHLNDKEKTLYEGSLDAAFDYLKDHPEVRELILTGGDPLSVTDITLERLFKRVSTLPHIKMVRIHSRMCVTLPTRFNGPLLEILGRPWGFQVTVVSSFNHSDELTSLARASLTALRRRGVMLLNQSVLMKDVNDSVETLRALCQDLYELGVHPYYLHHPDWTPGTFHFRISIERGRQIVGALKGLLSGPAMPDYILDIPQGHGKVSLLGNRVKKVTDFNSDPSLSGSVYEVTPPSTLATLGKEAQSTEKVPSTKRRYLDLFSPQ